MTPLLTALAVLVVAWFATGSAVNVRRGAAALRWLQGGLPRIGARTTVRWLGTSAVQLVLREPRAPFQEATVIVFLEPRDVPWWPLARARGRRDTLIVRAQLRDAPRAALEVVDPRSWSGREVLRRLPAGEWGLREPVPAAGQPGLVCVGKDRSALPLAAAAVAHAVAAGALRRVSIRPTAPHLQLHVDLAAPTAPAAALFDTLRSLGELASHGHLATPAPPPGSAPPAPPAARGSAGRPAGRPSR